MIALVFGQILPFSVGDKVRVAAYVGGAFMILDLLVRLPLYYWLVHGSDWKPRTSRLEAWFLFLEDRLLIRTNILREHERGVPATAVHFALGVLTPLSIGIPMWAVVPAVVIFGFGDPSARVVGKKFGGSVVWRGGTKRWTGMLGYFYVGSILGLMTVLLQSEFPLYPTGFSTSSLTISVILTAAVGAYFESLCEKDSSMFSKIVDDNFVVPFVGAVAFYAFVTAGTT